mmetsp:Transcript_45587/g.177360  ORF Transcript_45587/g.177360 Transcript_45587/m.177360 type:complete len:409 (-) Transcript_45587:913-2139(-)
MSIHPVVTGHCRRRLLSRRWMSSSTVLPVHEVLEDGSTAFDVDGTAEVLERVSTPVRTNARTLLLNRPKALNALSKSMCKRVFERVSRFDESDLVSAVILRSTTRKAFCAGGDVRTVALTCKDGRFEEALDFFRHEYHMDYLLGSLKTTKQISFIEGICMGGGAGISVHGSYRVASESTVFAMPECNIGLVPDIGASYFLPRLPRQLGRYLALTGARLNGAAAVAAGVATHYVPTSLLDSLERRLSEVINTREFDPDIVRLALEECTEAVAPIGDYPNIESIESCFGKDTVEEILDELGKLQADGGGAAEFAKEAIDSMTKANPLSLKLALEAQKRGSKSTLRECFEMEFALVANLVMGTGGGDFYEGIRAALIDKDRNPKWTLKSIRDVEAIDQYFQLPAGVDELFS